MPQVSKTYKGGTASALKEVSLVLPPGQVTALLGANGSGKSTLTHILCGLISPTHGDAFLFGHSVAKEVSVLRTSIGLCSRECAAPRR